MNVLPSMSWIFDPDARRMKSGDPPTALNARTGLSTPPGRIRKAREKRREERVVRIVVNHEDTKHTKIHENQRALRVFVSFVVS
jgi:hypothetical protein